MSKAEAIKRIEELEGRKFLVWMTERWTNEDRRNLDRIDKELKELREFVK
jgi:hypothetical protein